MWKVVAERIEANELFKWRCCCWWYWKTLRTQRYTKGGVLMLSILQGAHKASYKAFTRLHKVFVHGVYNAAQQAFTRFFLMITSPQRRNWTSACPQAPGFEVLSEHQPESLWQSEHFWQPSAQRAARGFFRPQRGDEHLRRRQHITALPRGLGGGSSQPPRISKGGGAVAMIIFHFVDVLRAVFTTIFAIFFARFLEHFYKVFTTFLQGVLQGCYNIFAACFTMCFARRFTVCLQGVLQGF